MSLTNILNSSLSSSAVYVQICSVCKGEFSERNDWLKHLTLENHQKLARKECINNWNSELRKCCLIIYTSEPLTDNTTGEIVNYFSKEIIGDIVTDFVWWEDRPHMAILQFESRSKAECRLNSSGCQDSQKIRISDSQSVQVKKGVDLLELEWLAILPPKDHNSTLTAQATKRNSAHLSSEESQNSSTLTITQNENLPAIQNSPVQVKVEQLESHQSQNTTPSSPKRIRLSDSNNNGCTSVQSEINPPGPQEDPPQNQLTEPLPTQSININPLISVNLDKPSLPFPFTRKSHPLQFEYWTIQKSISLPHPPNIHECLTQMETQVNLLFDYISQFDPRIPHLITLITNWSTLNSINLVGERNPNNSLPPHHTIKWLVIFFLSNKKYIPTLRQILLRHPDKTQLKDEDTGTNIGFHCDPTFVQEWKVEQQKRQIFVTKRKTQIPQVDTSFHIPSDEFSDNFLLSVFHLFWKFLHFYECTWSGGIEQVANLQTGQLIYFENLLRPTPTLQPKLLEKYQGNKGPEYWLNAITSEEIDTLVNAVKMERALWSPSENYYGGMYMTHPFLYSYKICLAKDIKISFKHFGNAYRNIMYFLERVEQVGVKVGLMEFGRLRNVLTIKKKNWSEILKKRVAVKRIYSND